MFYYSLITIQNYDILEQYVLNYFLNNLDNSIK